MHEIANLKSKFIFEYVKFRGPKLVEDSLRARKTMLVSLRARNRKSQIEIYFRICKNFVARKFVYLRICVFVYLCIRVFVYRLKSVAGQRNL